MMIRQTNKAPRDEAARAAVHYRMQVYDLRDQLRREFIRCAEQQRPFPLFTQHMLDRLEAMISAQERSAVLRRRTRASARRLRS